MAKCDASCLKQLNKCSLDCTFGSQGCIQDCISTNVSGVNLLTCAYDKCINLWLSVFLLYLYLFNLLRKLVNNQKYKT